MSTQTDTQKEYVIDFPRALTAKNISDFFSFLSSRKQIQSSYKLSATSAFKNGFERITAIQSIDGAVMLNSSHFKFTGKLSEQEDNQLHGLIIDAPFGKMGKLYAKTYNKQEDLDSIDDAVNYYFTKKNSF